MLPANERLDAHNGAAFQVDFWLVMQHKLLLCERTAQTGLDGLPLHGPSVHPRLEKSVVVAPAFLGVIHCGVRALDQGLRVQTIVGVDADADTHADMEFIPVNVVRQCERGMRFLGRKRCVFCVFNQGQQQHKFIAALTTDGIRLAHTSHQSFGHRLQQVVAHRMAQGVVDMFKEIQVHVHQRQAPALSMGGIDGLGEPVLQQHSIGQIGEHIVMRQMIEMNLGHFDLFGHLVRFNAGDHQTRVRLLQHQQLIIRRCPRRFSRAHVALPRRGDPFTHMGFAFAHLGRQFAKTSSIFTLVCNTLPQMHTVFAGRGQFFAAQDDRLIVRDRIFPADDV